MEQIIDNRPLKYQGYAIVLQEVPDEITLAFNISGCPHHCEGCHSQNLWEYKGNILKNEIKSVINQYKEYITCVCFMGGDQNISELKELCKLVKDDYGLKTCIYSGEDTIDKFNTLISKKILDYLKIGKYNKKLGGLQSKVTNQKMYKIKDGDLCNITWKFLKIKEKVK
jgi:anaerobic ribonucleoside-triphosphate reductase activating protein